MNPKPSPPNTASPASARGTRLWDGWLRLFHWTLAGAVAVCLYTGLFGGFEAMDWHQWGGYAVLTLVLFRFAWGLVGPETARFRDFLQGPGAVASYVKALRGGQAPQRRGHNPLGGWAVLLILGVLGAQAVSGLFTTDDLFVEGPLYELASEAVARLANQLHGLGPWTVGGVVGLHLLALLAHRFALGERLVGAMFTGRRPEETGEDVQGRPLLGTLLLGLAGLAVWALVTQLP